MKLASGLDPLALLHELAIQPRLWNQYPFRHKSPVHSSTDDIVLRYQALRQGDSLEALEDLSTVEWPAWGQLPSAWPFVLGLMSRVGGARLGRVLITRLAPGGGIPLHSDSEAADASGLAPYAAYYRRYHVPLACGPGCQFTSGDETVEMAPGEAWWVDNVARHQVVNWGAVDRVHLLVDIRPAGKDLWTPEAA